MIENENESTNQGTMNPQKINGAGKMLLAIFFGAGLVTLTSSFLYFTWGVRCQIDLWIKFIYQFFTPGFIFFCNILTSIFFLLSVAYTIKKNT